MQGISRLPVRSSERTQSVLEAASLTDSHRELLGFGTGYAGIALLRLGVAGQCFGKKLEGHVTAELEIFGFKNNTHASAADFPQDAVVGERLPERLERRCHWRRW